MAATKYITVFVPTYNGEKYLGESINAILSQELPKGYKLELLITDSGSKDRSVDIIKAYGDKVTFDQISNSEFSHGRTRQRAAEKAKGEYILFITQDATPTDTHWIINMVEPFQISNRIGCVFGRQIPRPYAVPTIKREVSSVFNGFGAHNSIVIHNKRSLASVFDHPDYNYFFSDVNSAIRKDLIHEIPFRDVKYAEDMALAEDMEAAGYLKAYSPRGAVWHSNEYSFQQYYHRKFDEFLGIQHSTNQTLKMTTKEWLLGWIKPTLADWSFIRHDREYNLRAKLKFFVIAPIFNINEKRGKHDAIKYSHNEEEVTNRSLEQRGKNRPSQ